MPDPRDPTPLRVRPAGGRFIVVDRDGRRVKGGVASSEDEAQALKGRIEAAWSSAKAGRRAKGAPEITESAALEEFRLPLQPMRPIFGAKLRLRFDPRLHPRDRLGQFAKVLGRLRDSPRGSTLELPHGVIVTKGLTGLQVSGPGGARRPESTMSPGGEHLTHPVAAAAVALREMDKGEVAHGADPAAVHHQGMQELRTAEVALARAGADMTDYYAIQREEQRARVAHGVAVRYDAAAGGRTPELMRGAHHVTDPARALHNLADAGAALRATRARHERAAEDVIRRKGLRDHPLPAGARRGEPAYGGKLVDSIKRNLARMPVTRDADEETKATHRALRRELGMNPDIHKRGDAPSGKARGLTSYERLARSHGHPAFFDPKTGRRSTRREAWPPTTTDDAPRGKRRAATGYGRSGAIKWKGGRLEGLRKVADEHSAREIEGFVVDPTTASLLLKVHDALKPGNRERFESMPLPRLVDVAWKAATPGKRRAAGDYGHLDRPVGPKLGGTPEDEAHLKAWKQALPSGITTEPGAKNDTPRELIVRAERGLARSRESLGHAEAELVSSRRRGDYLGARQEYEAGVGRMRSLVRQGEDEVAGLRRKHRVPEGMDLAGKRRGASEWRVFGGPPGRGELTPQGSMPIWEVGDKVTTPSGTQGVVREVGLNFVQVKVPGDPELLPYRPFELSSEDVPRSEVMYVGHPGGKRRGESPWRPLTGEEGRIANATALAGVARSRIAYLEGLGKPTKAQRTQLAREREALKRFEGWLEGAQIERRPKVEYDPEAGSRAMAARFGMEYVGPGSAEDGRGKLRPPPGHSPHGNLADAFHDKVGSRVYLASDGNYHYRKGSGGGGQIPAWNDAVKAEFGTDQVAFHKAATDFIRPVTLPSGKRRGFEGYGDFESDDPYERHLAHQAAKGNLDPPTDAERAERAALHRALDKRKGGPQGWHWAEEPTPEEREAFARLKRIGQRADARARGKRRAPSDYRPFADAGPSAGGFVDPNTIAVPTKFGPVTFESAGDQVGPEYHATYLARLADGTAVGTASVSYLGDEIAVQMIEVPPQYRRGGVASALIQRARNDRPGRDVTITTLGDVTTDEGRAFIASGRRSRWNSPGKRRAEADYGGGPLAGLVVKDETVGGSAGMPQTLRYLIADTPDGERAGLFTYEVRDGFVWVDGVAVADKFRGRGVAYGLLEEMHRRTGLPVVHGGFVTPEGIEFGVAMAAGAPEWNKLALDYDANGNPVFWQPGEPVTEYDFTAAADSGFDAPDLVKLPSAFSPLKFDSYRRANAAIERGLEKGRRHREAAKPPGKRRAAPAYELDHLTGHVREEIGVTPFRAGVDDPAGFYESERFRDFQRAVGEIAPRFGVEVERQEPVTGFWEGEEEPSVALVAHDGEKGVAAYAAELGRSFGQEGVLLFEPADGDDLIATFDRAELPRGKVYDALREAELPAGRFDREGRLQIIGSGPEFVGRLDRVAESLGGVGYEAQPGRFALLERENGDYDRAIEDFGRAGR